MQAAMLWFERQRDPNAISRAPARQPELQSRTVYAEKGQVPESTIGLGVRAWGFGRCMHACTRAIWRKRFGADALLWLT